MTDILSTKDINQHVTLGISKGLKNAVFIAIAISVDILIRNETMISEEHKAKKTFEIIFYAVWVTSPQSWVIDPIVEIMSWSNPYKWLFYFDYSPNFEGL